MSTSLQAWKLLRTKDLAVQEIMEERRAAIESGRLKGRRLFEPMEGNTNENHYKNGFSGDMGDQESEVRSLSFDYSEDEESSSSLPCLSKDKDQEANEVEEECYDSHIGEVTFKQGPYYKVTDSQISTVNFWSVVFSRTCDRIEAVVEKTRIFGGRYIVIVLGMVAIALLIFAMYMSWTRNFEGHEGILVPT